jgi:Tfp pilus assembly protein PilF
VRCGFYELLCKTMGPTSIGSPPVNTPPFELGSGATPSAHKSPWIYGPVIDLLAGCGAWSAPLLLLAFYAAHANAYGWTVGFYFLALLFNYPHFMATVYRAYHSQSEFAKYKTFTVHIALLLALAGVAAHLWYAVLPWIFTLYICWSPWHYTGQNFGLLMMFARRAGAVPTVAERRALRLSFVASFILLMLSFHTGASGDPLVLSLGLKAAWTVPERAVLAAFFLGASAWALVSMARRSGWRAVIPSALLAVTQFLWFLLPALIELFSGRDVPQTRYSSGVLAVLHSTQYLWITSYYQQREARAAGVANWRLRRYLVTIFAGGIALFVPGPWIVSRVFHVDFTASLLTFTALINIHHFILDGALWKLRDTRNAALLLDQQSGTSEVQRDAQTTFPGVAKWIAGPTPWARGLRIAAVVILVLWAAVDQLHFYWSGSADNLPALQQAAKWMPDDSNVQVRLAHAETRAGQRDAAVAALQRAATVSPANPRVQQEYGRGLIEAGRVPEAYVEYQKITTQWPGDVDALVNYGLLAVRLGHSDEAVDSWQRAVAIDPGQGNAQLYLAQMLDDRGEAQAAARHYRDYLQILAGHPAQYVDARGSVPAILVKVADADAAVGHDAVALQGYQAGFSFAEKSGDKAIESLALVHLAALQEKQGDAGGAARSYQQALGLDEGLADARSGASDWLNYGQFLRRHRQPERLVFACLLHAEELLRGTPGQELSAVVQVRQESEARLGAGAVAARGEYVALFRTALALPTAAFSDRR